MLTFLLLIALGLVILVLSRRLARQKRLIAVLRSRLTEPEE